MRGAQKGKRMADKIARVAGYVLFAAFFMLVGAIGFGVYLVYATPGDPSVMFASH
jgi:hypothetical protein